MIISLLLLCACSILLYYYIVRYRRFVRLINKIPSSPTIPLLGHTIELGLCTQEDFWNLQRRLCKSYYPLYKLWCGPIAFVSVHHPDDLEKILSSTKEHLSKGHIYTMFYPWLGTGLLTSDGMKWHKRRKILTPTFHFNILKQFVEILIEEANRMTNSLRDKKETTIDDLVSFVSHHTLNAICETAMGISLQEMGIFQKQYRQAVYEMGSILVYRTLKPWLTPDIIFALTSLGKRHNKNLKILHGFTEKIIAERKQYHENTNGRYLKHFENDTNTIEEDEIIGIKKKRLAMLDLLIAAGYNNEMNDSDIREEVDTFMFEGHDTVAMGLTYAILLIAEHKNVQERIRNEVSAEMQANGGKLIMSALNSMPYLERCLKESLRLYPSVPFISRVLSEDVKMQSYVVPCGTVLHLNIYDIHRDPNFWPNPDVFDPDRFLPEKNQNRHPYSYLPFSAGPRNCIGKRYAMLELKAIMASLVYNFYLEPVDYLKDIRFMTDMIIWLQNDWIFSLIPKGREQTKTLKILHEFTDRIIAERKLYHERINGRYLKSFGNDTSTETDDAETFGIQRKRLAMMDFLIAPFQEGLLTNVDIREEVDTFMFEERVRNEVYTTLQENGQKFTMKSLQNLQYLDRCIKKALRLYLSVFFISHVSAEDVKLQSYLVPAGTIIHLNIYAVHRDSNFWPNPEVFDPDRFLPEEIQNRHLYSYIPFSAGPRNCIDQRYALLEMKAMIAPLVYNLYLD